MADSDAANPAAGAGQPEPKKRPKDPLVGTVQAGKYHIVEIIGQGGFGTVYRVENTTVQADPVAMKVLSPKVSADPQFRELFLKEIHIAHKVVHKYIVQIRDFGELDDGRLYYTMDYVAGKPLALVLRKQGPLKPRQAMSLFGRILQAVGTAHEAGVLHLDLKPANIMVEVDGTKLRPRILDFGIAHAMGAGSERGQRAAGSPSYMPIEQFERKGLGFYTDLYALGVTLFECLTGSVPIRGKAKEIYQKLKAGERPRPIADYVVDADSHVGLQEALDTALALNYEDRFQNAVEFRNRLSDIARGAGGEKLEFAEDPFAVTTPKAAQAASSAPRPSSSAPKAKPKPRPPRNRQAPARRPSSTPVVPMIAIFGVILIGGIGWAVFGGNKYPVAVRGVVEARGKPAKGAEIQHTRSAAKAIADELGKFEMPIDFLQDRSASLSVVYREKKKTYRGSANLSKVKEGGGSVFNLRTVKLNPIVPRRFVGSVADKKSSQPIGGVIVVHQRRQA
ncbi:MAG: serine/threonine-protein kinase, partial [Planctomycetota bacterium]